LISTTSSSAAKDGADHERLTLAATPMRRHA
jgi:hypothetical protein